MTSSATVFFSEKVMPDLLTNIELPDEGLVADVGRRRGHDLLASLKKATTSYGIVFELKVI